ncbi:hypothetical protein CDAR_596611 [Caerostris darwini]|uniref:Uncharacterized protein n=1 Tax=Caerostris darwini TaxID=1538125 RepID=A0AAV4WCU2_9ARAC|nr:hypothetical protein CDAR_596611 [Caerostris darwini]
MDGLTTSHILTKCHLFDMIWGDGLPSSFSGKSNAERKWRSIVENGASRRKEYYQPSRTIRETNGLVLFHCATSSEPFVSFNAPESDGPPRACQKVCNIPLFVLLFSRQKKLLLNYDVRKELNTANKLVVTVWDPSLNVLQFLFFVDRQLVTCCELFLLKFYPMTLDLLQLSIPYYLLSFF